MTITDEHRAQLPAWRDKWLANALSTQPMNDIDRQQTVWALNGLYEVSGKPPPAHIAFVSSPFMIRFAGAFAAGLERIREKQKITLPTSDTIGFEGDLVRTTVALLDGPPVSVLPPTGIESDEVSINSNWFRLDQKAVRRAARTLYPADPGFLLSCAAVSYRMWQGGNQWSAWVGFLSFFRDVVGQTLTHENVWKFWSAATVHSGPRMVHPKFLVVSDRPATLTIDEQLRPHNADGPFAAWRDGTGLYAWRGLRIPRWIIERKDLLTVKRINAEPNAETRRAMIEIMTPERYIRDGASVKVHEDETGTLWHRTFSNGLRPNDTWACVEVINGTREPDGTFKRYYLQVPPECRTAKEAVAWTYNMTADDYSRLVVRT